MKQEVNNLNLNFTHWPYFWLDSENSNADAKDKWAVFLGSDFYSMLENDAELFINKTNQCLDYIRKICSDCRLIYRIHPDEKGEHKLLDLTSFSVEKDDKISEDFLWANKEKIKYVFSVCSASSIAGLNMGLNSYCFYNNFGGVFKGAYKIFVDHYLSGLPSNFFIDNLGAPLLENKIKLKEDERLKESFGRVLTENKGPVWFIVTENRYLLAIRGLARMIRGIFPARPINLIVSKHHRWSDGDLEELRNKFDKVLVFTRSFYSLKPSKLISAFITARKIKKLSLEDGSVLVGFAHHDFIENCFISYNKDKFKVAVLPEIAWRLHFRTKELGFDVNKFLFNKASFFYRWFFEPFLGLNRTIFRHYGGASAVYFIRLQKELEEVYDKVYLIKNSPL